MNHQVKWLLQTSAGIVSVISLLHLGRERGFI